MNDVKILPCKNRKIDKNHLFFLYTALLAIKYSLVNSVCDRIYACKSSG